ncbi:MAG: uL15 family ribosomal protein [Nitrososphaeraceae archaeon]|jgi:large subunit ribosomal protein L15
MATRFRKSRRYRGSRYCGWGQIGQHRQSGSRGGVGNAGKHKHLWIRTVIEEPDHFGHDSVKSHNRNVVSRWINVRDLDSLIQEDESKRDSKGLYILDLNSLGYDKLLGGGQVNGKFEVRINRISDKAREKVEQSGGEVVVISNEKYNAK